jgi:predicted  nucleic acid-binding Zn-ribbon protein
MNPTPKKSQLQQDLNDAREDLRGMRDEIRVQLHLASMELKTEWERLQPKMQEAEKYWDVVSDAALETAHDLRKHLQDFKKKLGQLKDQHSTRPH